jgi:predicted nuclease of predicted toxin-antitoxin system
MKFLLDENVEYRLGIFLKKQGHNVTAIAHDYSNALADQEVLAIAAQEQRTLITNDRTDFYKLIFEKHLPHHGVIIIHINEDNIEVKKNRLAETIKHHINHIEQHYLIIMPTGVIVQPEPHRGNTAQIRRRQKG